MENFDNNTSSELLTLLLDGELDRTQEQRLFDSLSSDADLQSELQDMLAIRESVRGDTEAFTPPAATSKAIFASLGYAPPSGVTKAPFWKAILSRKPAIVAAAIVAALFTGGMLYMNSSSGDEAPGLAVKNIPISSSVSTGSTEYELLAVGTESETIADAEVSLNQSSAENEAATHETKYADKAALSSPTSSNGKLIAAHQTAQQQANHSYISINRSESDFAMLASGMSLDRSRNMLHQINSSRRQTATQYDEWEITLRAMSMNGNAPLMTGMNNISIGCFRSFGQYFRFGVEVGQEEFSRLKSTGGVNPPMASNDEVVWFAAGFIHDMSYAEFAGATPFLQIMSGSQSGFGGVHLRGMVGFDYCLTEFLGLKLGYEMSQINYSVDNNSEWTKNNGFTAGLKFNF